MKRTSVVLGVVAVAASFVISGGSALADNPQPASVDTAKTPVIDVTPLPVPPESLAKEIAIANAYLASVSGDPETIVCLTAQGTLALTILLDGPSGMKPSTRAEKQRSCEQEVKGSHTP
jgi:hypothetical protein